MLACMHWDRCCVCPGHAVFAWFLHCRGALSWAGEETALPVRQLRLVCSFRSCQPQVLKSMSCVHCELLPGLSLTAGGLLWPPLRWLWLCDSALAGRRLLSACTARDGAAALMWWQQARCRGLGLHPSMCCAALKRAHGFRQAAEVAVSDRQSMELLVLLTYMVCIRSISITVGNSAQDGFAPVENSRPQRP